MARAYKSLSRVERTFREQKSTLEIRPLYHHRDDTSIGHIVACFLPLRLEVDLQRRLDARGVNVAWPDLMRDLAQVQAVTVTLDGQRTACGPTSPGAHHASAAAGVRPPAPVTALCQEDPLPEATPAAVAMSTLIGASSNGRPRCARHASPTLSRWRAKGVPS